MPARKQAVIEDHAAWIAEAVAAPFHTPRRLPSVKRTGASIVSMLARQPSLWSQVGEELPEHAAPEHETVDHPPSEFEYPPFTPKQQAGIDSFAWGQSHQIDGADHRKVWFAFIAEHAGIFEMEVRMPKGFSAKIRLTSTRLGFTAGYSFEEPRSGCGGGGYLTPQVDDEGWFLWNSREAAIQEAANELWTEFDYPAGKDAIRKHFAKLNIDVEARAGGHTKRRIVSRATIIDRSRQDLPAIEVPSMKAYEEYERSAGLTDVDGPPTGAVIEEPAQQRPAMRLPLAPGMRKPRAGEGWWVRHSVQKILPEGVPTYVREVVGIRTSGASVVIADLLLWDGSIGRLRISGYPAIDGGGYQWIDAGVPGTAFHWDEVAKSWTRIPHP